MKSKSGSFLVGSTYEVWVHSKHVASFPFTEETRDVVRQAAVLASDRLLSAAKRSARAARIARRAEAA